MNWYLTPAWKAGTCDECGCEIRKGDALVWQHELRTGLCTLCADGLGHAFWESRRWKARQEALKGRLAGTGTRLS